MHNKIRAKKTSKELKSQWLHLQIKIKTLKLLRNCSRKLFLRPPQKLAEIQPTF